MKISYPGNSFWKIQYEPKANPKLSELMPVAQMQNIVKAMAQMHKMRPQPSGSSPF